MIRFIDLTNQTTDDTREFAWYDTVGDEFICLHGLAGETQTWYTWQEFQDDFDCHMNGLVSHLRPAGRFRALAPAWVFEQGAAQNVD